MSKAVLIVDDDDDIRDSLRDILEDEGYSVLEAANGRDALAELKRAPVSLVLLDLMMPIMDGWEFRRRQVTDPSIAGIPVVAITASGRANGGLGGVEVLKKPLRVDALLKAVAEKV